jgi:hypothetical protein
MTLKKCKKIKSCANWLSSRVKTWKENKSEIKDNFWRWALSNATFTELLIAAAISLVLCFVAYQAADDLIEGSVKCDTCIIEDAKLRTIEMNERINQINQEAKK